MNSNFLSNISNSSAAQEPSIGVPSYITVFSAFSQSMEEKQSSSVTPSGLLWQQKLALMVSESPLPVSQSELKKNELRQSATQSQKIHGLIQLLKSWREGDEQEQRDTWEYLKQALDEDRLSERKLFP